MVGRGGSWGKLEKIDLIYHDNDVFRLNSLA